MLGSERGEGKLVERQILSDDFVDAVAKASGDDKPDMAFIDNYRQLKPILDSKTAWQVWGLSRFLINDKRAQRIDGRQSDGSRSISRRGRRARLDPKFRNICWFGVGCGRLARAACAHFRQREDRLRVEGRLVSPKNEPASREGCGVLMDE